MSNSLGTQLSGAQTSRFVAACHEKLAEKAEHTPVCEHFLANFSWQDDQIWTFPSWG